MGLLKDKKLISLREIEGPASPHQRQLEMALKNKQQALEYVADVAALAEFIGGKVQSLGLGEDWALSKEIYPGVEAFFVFNRADTEFPSSLKVLFGGENVKPVRGEELASFAILYVSHMLRYVKESNRDKKLPEVCYKV
ncbi:MAG: hypothetical protein FJZ94_08525 [Chloroflexi bacterium]|nr:hypothetical protein [Chloroflexota bacterium]MBM4452410.1 hypothetical protein [Chloroflexota bacterium]MBM4454409.1 hypothetical protein [Chloroflexota bacterium]